MSGSGQSVSSVAASADDASTALAPPAGLARRLLPWVVTLAVVGWLLWPYRSEEGRALLFNAFSKASGWTIPVGLAATVCVWLADSFAVARTFQRWGAKIELRETCLLRGATFLFDAMNPALGQAVLTLVMHRRGMPLPRVLVIVALMGVIFLGHIALMSGVGLAAGAAPHDQVVPILVVGALALGAVYLTTVALRPAALARNETLRWLMHAGLRGHAWAFLYRVPSMAVLVTAQVLLMRCFGIDLPLSVALFYLPTIMFIGGMPISVQGLGPGQLAAIAFFSRYVEGDAAAAEATILAYGFAGMVLITLGAALVGVCCIATPTGRQSLAAATSLRARSVKAARRQPQI